MSYRTLVELNHDYCPKNDKALLEWSKAMVSYMRTGDQALLPQGVEWIDMRHHSEPCPLERKIGPKMNLRRGRGDWRKSRQ